MLRSILGVGLGVVLAVVLIFAIQGLGMMLYPLPEGTDMSSTESMGAAMRNMPAGAFALLLAGYAIGTLAGAWLAATIARRSPVTHGMIIGGLFLIGNIANVSMIPHPTWYVVVSMLVFPLAAFLGAKLAARPA